MNRAFRGWLCIGLMTYSFKSALVACEVTSLGLLVETGCCAGGARCYSELGRVLESAKKVKKAMPSVIRSILGL